MRPVGGRAYAQLMSAAFIDEVFADRAAHVLRRREQLAAGRATWVAELERAPRQLVGFVSSGPARLADASAPHELYALYTRAAVWGRGVGQALHEVAVGDRAAYLWTLEGNERSRAFYERQGYRDDGDLDMAVEGDRADGATEVHLMGRHLRMVRLQADRSHA